MTQNRTCRDCTAPLTLGENWTEGQQRTRSYLCRGCVTERGKKHYKMHSDRAAELQRVRLSKPENFQKAAALKSAYYAANKDKWAGYKKAQRVKELTTPAYRAARLVTWVRARAAKRGWEFDLTREWALNKLDAGLCEVTGIPFVLCSDESFAINPWAPSIDRIDSRLGYLQSNCRMVVWAYNVAKSEWGDAEVLRLAKAIVDRADER